MLKRKLQLIHDYAQGRWWKCQHSVSYCKSKSPWNDQNVQLWKICCVTYSKAKEHFLLEMLQNQH